MAERMYLTARIEGGKKATKVSVYVAPSNWTGPVEPGRLVGSAAFKTKHLGQHDWTERNGLECFANQRDLFSPGPWWSIVDAAIRCELV